MANEAATGLAMLNTVLTGDATLMALVTGVFRDVAPEGTAPDWIVIGHQSDQDTLSGVGSRIMTRHVDRVLVVGPESDGANIRAAADRLDALLQPAGLPLRNSNGTLACYREQALLLSSIVPGSGSGAAWLLLGGLYRVEI